MRCASRMTSWRSKGRRDRRPPCLPASGAREQAAASRRAIVRDGRCRHRRCDHPKRTALRRHPVAKLTRQLQARVGVVEYVVLTRSRRDCRTALARGRASRSREARQQSAGGSRRTPARGPRLLVAPHRQREQLVRRGQALEPLDGDEASISPSRAPRRPARSRYVCVAPGCGQTSKITAITSRYSLADVAALIGEPTRAAMLLALFDGAADDWRKRVAQSTRADVGDSRRSTRRLTSRRGRSLRPGRG